MDPSKDKPNGDDPANYSEQLDLSGIDLLLRASKQTEPKVNASSLKTATPESGIDLLIKASEVIKSEAIVTPTKSGLPALLQAADMLESYSADIIRAFIPGPRVPPFCAAQSDASSSASVDFAENPVDVAISWLERHLANCERDSKSNWLQDHSYIRPRPVYTVKGSEASEFGHTSRPVQVVMPTSRQDDDISAPSPAKRNCGESTGSRSNNYNGTVRRLLSHRDTKQETVAANDVSSPPINRPVAVVKPYHYVPI